MAIDIINIAQRIGDRAYDTQLPDQEEASKVYTISTQAALDVLKDMEEQRFEPDWEALGREPLGSGMQDSRDSAEAPGIQ